jgi:hypothetical protein
MSQLDNPAPSPEQAALFARVKRMMLIASATTAVAVAAVLVAVGYRLFHVQGSAVASASGFTDVTATLPKGAHIAATAVAGDKIVLTVEEGGTTEIRTYDAQTLKPVGRLKFTTEP